MPESARVKTAIERMRFVQLLLHQYCDELTDDEWFWQPTEGVTHIGWQIAHVAVSHYGLTMKRVRGERPEDAEFLPEAMMQTYGRGSNPNPDPAANLPPKEILLCMDRVIEASVKDLADATDEQLEVAVDPPHPAFRTKLEAVEFSPQHSMLHAGQIALLRRLMGKAPLR